MSIGGNKIQGGCPIEDSLFTKILPDFRPIFCPIMADFCKFFQRWEGCSPPSPLSPTPMEASFVKRKQEKWAFGHS